MTTKLQQRKLKERPFQYWKISQHEAISPDNKYVFWIANGFWFFSDEGSQQLLSLVTIYERYKIWRKLKQEMILRVDELLEN